MDDFVLLGELNRILRVGVHDLNEAAKRLRVPLSVVQGAFEDGLLKGHWKVADGKLLMHLSPAETTKRPPGSSLGAPIARLPHNGNFTPSPISPSR